MTDTLNKKRAYNKQYIQKLTDEANSIVIKKPAKKNWNRREEAGKSLLAFIQTYYSDEFYKPFSEDHIEVINSLEQTGRVGGKRLVLMARGSGKTSITARGCLYFALYGIRKFLVMIASDEAKASGLLTIIRNDLEGNEKLKQDFPEICSLICKAEGSRVRYKRLKYKGKVVGGELGSEEITVNDLGISWGCKGFTIVSKGITGNIRGLQHSLPDGKIIRPDLVLCDDIQSQASKTEVDTIERLLVGAVGSLAGPMTQIATFVLLTVISRSCLCARLQESHPEFQVSKYKLVESFPEDEETLKLWEQYNEIRINGGKQPATDFYSNHREQMDKGFKVRWEHRIRDNEISAQESAWNLREEHRLTFDCDFQNTPSLHVVAGYDLTLEDVIEKRNHLKPMVVPEGVTIAYAIDVNINFGIAYVGLAGKPDGSYYLFDYGRFPSSGSLWKQGDAISEEQAIYKGILQVVEDIKKKRITDDLGNDCKPQTILVDLGYRREAVQSAIAQLRRQGTNITGCRGFGGQSYSPRSPLRKGDNWHLSKYGNGTAIALNVDTWRERCQRGFLLPPGSPSGSISLNEFGEERIKELGEHIVAERIVDTLISKEKGLTYYKWLATEAHDYCDCITYCLVALSSAGINWNATGNKPVAKKEEPKKLPPIPIKRPGLSPMGGIGRATGGWINRF